MKYTRACRISARMIMAIAIACMIYGLTKLVIKKDEPFVTPMVRIVSNPQAYQNQQVCVGGFLSVSMNCFPEAVLFLHEDECRFDVYGSSIRVVLPEGAREYMADINHRYAFVWGCFSAKERCAGVGTIMNVEIISVLPVQYGSGPTNEVTLYFENDGRISKILSEPLM